VKLSQILRRAAAFLAGARQPVAFDCGWVRTHQVVEKGLAADYGFDHVEHGADFVIRDGSLVANTLVWSDADDLGRDIDSCGRGDLRRPRADLGPPPSLKPPSLKPPELTQRRAPPA